MDNVAHKVALNLTSSDFDGDVYVSNLLQKKGLDELVAIEEDMVQNVRRLDSEMQQLVYENYSKFLTATNTIRHMEGEFNKMGDIISGLSNKIESISSISDSICSTFAHQRKRVKKLNEANTAVKGLQEIVRLPQRLQSFVAQRDYNSAVNSYALVKKKLLLYKDVPSMTGIYQDCKEIMDEVETKLRERLESQLTATDEIMEAVGLLKLLDMPVEKLELKLTESWNKQMAKDMNALKDGKFSDILEFTEHACCNFLTTVSIASSLYLQLFDEKSSIVFMQCIVNWVLKFEKLLDARFKAEANVAECALYVRALDRVYRKMATCVQLIPWQDCSQLNTNLVAKAAAYQITAGRDNAVKVFKYSLTETLEDGVNALQPTDDFTSLVQKLEQTYLVTVKTTLANLLLFTASDITFSSIESKHFFDAFSRSVYEEVIIESIMCIAKHISAFTELKVLDDVLSPLYYYLVIAEFLHRTQKKHLNYLMDLCQEQFGLTDRLSELTPFDTPNDKLEEVSKLVLRRYIDLVGMEMNHIVSVGVETTDWINCCAPTAVSNGILQFVKAMERIFEQTSILQYESPRKMRSPDTGRAVTPRHIASASTLETGSLSSALERMWNEKIDYNLVVEFQQDSVHAAIVKICLQTLIEIVRVKVFSMHGLQQMQVDCLYLKQQIWPHVSDEHVLTSLVDEVIASVVNQCDQPRMLEPAMAKHICENM